MSSEPSLRSAQASPDGGVTRKDLRPSVTGPSPHARGAGALGACSAALALAAALGAGPGAARAPVVLPVRFSVSDRAGTLDAEGAPQRRPRPLEAFLAAQLAEANAIFAPLGVSFREVARAPLEEAHAVLDTRRDRHALGPLVSPGVVHAFVVAFLRDVDTPHRSRQGVHWRPRGPGVPAGAHLVVLAGYAQDGVLAHELGHYLGNPRHSDVPGNVMSYRWGGERPTFDADQARRIHAFLRGAASDGTLRPLPP